MCVDGAGGQCSWRPESGDPESLRRGQSRAQGDGYKVVNLRSEEKLQFKWSS